MKRALILLIAFSFSTLVVTAQAKIPKSYQAIYTVKYHDIPAGTVTHILTTDKSGHYKFDALTRSTLLFLHLHIDEQSTGKLTSQGPRPDKYVYRYHFFNNKKLININFDWKNHIASSQKDERHYEAKIPTNAQDKLSYQLAMRYYLLNKIHPLTYHLVNRGNIDIYQFKQVGQETLDTPIGKIKTIKIRRINDDQDDDIFEFWTAPQYDYLLIQLKEINNGEVVAEAHLYKLTFT
ncbi:MAG: hypothetical protein A3C55_03335 [Gammaproteobacteria bacterium RIFCSPHIGHO2_02_FULL_42_13]|nr:MAG: hypothetical protein A3C55_03335 [Gammaproteobacteria bacterium RIFCSPHIGHO2_02_FULL_42_13]OGT68528.1 MAG: hypothetical protein A3H43_04945 [Gammaproteobacteria bacterium RIFCSPLOWO2_02_FULL_42_9]HLB57596.1 DUF3108 domain-containing protein [Gammaproteobacteria bacterium]